MKSNISFILIENVTTTSKAKPTTSKATNKKKNTPILEEEVTDGAATDGNGYIECRNKKSHHINRYGNPMGMIGCTFTVCPKYRERFPYSLVKGRIVGVVKQTGGQGDYFKFFDAYQYFEGPPEAGSDAWCYLPCKSLMSLDQRISHIKWDATSRSSKQKSKLGSSNKKQKSRSRYAYINV